MIRAANPGPMRGSRHSSIAWALSKSIFSPRESGFVNLDACAANESRGIVSEPLARYNTEPGATPPPTAILTHNPIAASPSRISAAFLSSLETTAGTWVGWGRSLNRNRAKRCWKMRYVSGEL
jgi:hypothetical protein